eukprot:15363475-Ditylum_brightwellii.AAC.1
MKFTIAASVILFLTKQTNAQDTCDISGSFSVSSGSCSFDGLVASIEAKLSKYRIVCSVVELDGCPESGIVYS